MAAKSGHKRRRRRNIGAIIVLIAAAVVLVVALWRLLSIRMDYRQSNQAYEELQGEVLALEDDGTNPDDSAGKPWNDYDWASVRVDFQALTSINPDVVAWIRFDDTEAVNVDYPILHSADNDTYLRHDLYGNYHTAGSIFLEAANAKDLSDLYNIIYGHNMRNGSMFGTLYKYRDNDGFYEENPYFTIYTPQGAYRYQIFGYADVSEDSGIYMVGFGPDESYRQLINRMLTSSVYNTGVVPTVNDRTVTLSTCTAAGDDYRFVVYGVCVDEFLYGE